MFAIVDIAGQQFKVEKGQKLFVHRLEGNEGTKITFEKVYLVDNEKTVTVGDPVIQGATVSATILNHLKGDKVLVFKKKRRKGYQKLTGHRQYLTKIQIEGISEKPSKPVAEQKAETVKSKEVSTHKEVPKAEKKAPEKEEKAKEVKKTTPKKSTPAKSTAKKAASAPVKTAAKPGSQTATKKDDKDKAVDKK